MGVPNDWVSTRMIGQKMNERNDCTVIALSLTTGISYPRALAALAEVGREPGLGAYKHEWLNALDNLGFRTEEINKQRIINRYPPRWQHRGVTTYSPRRFPEAFEWMKGSYIFHCFAHVSAFVGGQVLDWAAEVPKPVIEVLEVFRK